MELIFQPFNGQVGEKIKSLLLLNDFDKLTVIVAFAKNSGVLRIKKYLEEFRKKGGIVEFFVGIDLDGTSYEALKNLYYNSDKLNIVHLSSQQTFHPKIYFFSGKLKKTIIVGSNNLTGGGLWTNIENSSIVSSDICQSDFNKITKDIDDVINYLKSDKNYCKEVDSVEFIDELLKLGYIKKEIDFKLQIVKKSSKNKKSVFCGGVHAPLPKLSEPQKEKRYKDEIKIEEKSEVYLRNIEDNSESNEKTPNVFWCESKKLTGGSRNILDLSMTSFVEKGDVTNTMFDMSDSKRMKGSVVFFGINPNVQSPIKNITINYDGVDYHNNTILYPVGSNANGTWRLQIKGVSDNGTKITEAFRKIQKDYLVNKILSFTKVSDSYFFLTVSDESKLNDFKKASIILARNGNSRKAKQIGFI